ncbi:MAG: DUF2442 domain-containing protein [Gammaproteobacteria bacterium]|nr:DUF2442 domain-containing protein [Gammaproteobacteria bacterium]
MIPRIVEIKPLEGYRLWVRFHDGTSGTVDLSDDLWGPMFEPLKDPQLFAQARIDPELETVTWPNGADLAPEFLYQNANASHSKDAPRMAHR